MCVRHREWHAQWHNLCCKAAYYCLMGFRKLVHKTQVVWFNTHTKLIQSNEYCVYQRQKKLQNRSWDAATAQSILGTLLLEYPSEPILAFEWSL